MPNKVYSLHIGVAYVDKAHYGTTLTPLPCCPTDAAMMLGISQYLKYDKHKILINEDATVANVKETISTYSEDLTKGDLCVITYSGHGAEMIDLNDDEEGLKDQTWCLYDRQLLDDELMHLWKLFKKGSIFL